MAEQQCSVRRVSSEGLAALVHRLEAHGSYSAKIRATLLLLHSGVNTCPCHVTFVCEGTCEYETVVIHISEASPGMDNISIFTRDTAEFQELLCALLRWPELDARLWQRPFLLNAPPLCVLDALRPAAAAHGFIVNEMHEQRAWCRVPDGPALAPLPPAAGVRVGPLLQEHYGSVRRHWPHATSAEEGIIRDGIRAGLSAGAFVTAEAGQPGRETASGSEEPSAAPEEQLASWAVVSRGGHLGFLYTEEQYRRRGLARRVLALLTALCEQRALPCCVLTADDNRSVTNSLSALGYEPGHRVTFSMVTRQ